MNAKPVESKCRSKTCWLRMRAWLIRDARYTSLPPRGVAPVPILVQKVPRRLYSHPSVGSCFIRRVVTDSLAIAYPPQVRFYRLLQLSRLRELRVQLSHEALHL